MSDNDEWFWCLRHRRAEPAGQACRAEERMGPYPSREAAEHWRDRLDERNATWEAEDARWRGEPGSSG